MVNAFIFFGSFPCFPLEARWFLLLGRPNKQIASVIAPGAILLSFFLSIAAVWELTQLPGHRFEVIWATWLPSFGADWDVARSPSSIMILTVTGIAFAASTCIPRPIWPKIPALHGIWIF